VLSCDGVAMSARVNAHVESASAGHLTKVQSHG
jgi:hypothetical protein